MNRSLSPLDRLQATVRCNQGTVHEALENLLGSIDVATLTYRIVESDVLEIIREVALSLNRKPVTVKGDPKGFVLNRPLSG